MEGGGSDAMHNLTTFSISANRRPEIEHYRSDFGVVRLLNHHCEVGLVTFLYFTQIASSKGLHVYESRSLLDNNNKLTI